MNERMAKPANRRLHDARPAGFALRMVTCGLLASGTFAGAGCGRDGGVPDSELGELVLAPKRSDRPIDGDLAARDAGELGRAVTMSHARLLHALGPHRLRLQSTLEVKEAAGGKLVDQLSDDTTLEVAAEAAWHGVMNNSADYGREVIFLDGALFLRARYQRWHKRAPNDDAEPASLRERFYDGIAATWDLLAPAIAVADKGAVTVAGRPARKIALSTATSPRKPDPEPLAHRRWRETRTVSQLEGEAVIDAATGALLQLTLRGTVGYRREQTAYSMRVSISSSVTDLGAAGLTAAITAPDPEQVVLTPGRLHEVEERDKLLEGIAPPLRGAGKSASDPVKPSSASKPATTAKPATP
jgi:hypothetical protein